MEGRGSAVLAVVAAMVIVSAMAPGVSAVNHLVGGSKWDYPPSGDPNFYDGTWVPTQTFRVGDTLRESLSSVNQCLLLVVLDF